MQPSEALGTAAQIAVALAGFAGVVVAFRSGSMEEWHTIDKFRLRLLLSNSVVPLVLCMIAILLDAVIPQPPWIWRACSGVALVLTILFGSIITRGLGLSAPRELNLTGASKLLFICFGAGGVAAMLLQIYNVTTLNAFWPFYTSVVFQLITAAIQFVRLLLIRPQPSV